MANLRDIRDRIVTVKNTQQITKAMKMVAAAKLRKAQQRMLQTRPYASKLSEVIGKLASGSTESSVFLKPNDNPKSALLIIVGSDRGLCGGFNNNLFKTTELYINDELKSFKENGSLSLITVGRKATEYFNKRAYKVVKSFPGFFDNLQYEKSAAIMRFAMEQYAAGEFESVFLSFNEFKSVISQNRKIEQILPVPQPAEQEFNTDYIFEPNSDAILSKLIPLHLNTQLWKALLESNASEQGARMAAMDNATENASEIMRQLRLKYNQARQAAITTEISEIVSGAEALSE
ncbi:ATP synthase F1 subunit gamma [bacterium]|nr:MAG: ATP synthase F1 subunit gamma [bacterium]